MSISIQRDNNSKTLNIPGFSENNQGIDATLSRKSDFNSNNNIESDFEQEDEVGLEYLANTTKEDKKTSEIDDSDGEVEIDDVSDGEYPQEDEEYSGISFEEEQNLRARYLAQLKRLNQRGMVSQRRFGPEDSSGSIKAEVLRLKKEKEVENGINYCKQGLVFFANTIEMVNRNLPSSPANLDGWSAHVMRSQDDYDEVFEELYCKYGSSIEMGPEIKLLTMISGSAFMFHLNKLFAEKAMNGGNIADILSGFMNKGSPKKNSRAKEMSGPSMESEELLRKLSNDDFSDISSAISDDSEDEIIVEKPKKKRGRPAKTK
jgi:hypothetical protein